MMLFHQAVQLRSATASAAGLVRLMMASPRAIRTCRRRRRRPAGIVSGQPMPQWVTPPPIFGQGDRSRTPVDEGTAWLMRMIRSVGSY